jgi:HEAT repeat protein
VTPAAQRRGAICAALVAVGAVACASLLVLWGDARDPPANRPVNSDRSDQAVVAFAAPEQSLSRSPLSTLEVDGDPASAATRLDSADPLGVLIVALGDADANVRMDAVSDLGLLSDTRAESLLVSTAMQDPAPLVRSEALYALEMLGAESQLAVFRHALADPDNDVRKAAISALEELGGDAAAADALANIRTAR